MTGDTQKGTVSSPGEARKYAVAKGGVSTIAVNPPRIAASPAQGIHFCVPPMLLCQVVGVSRTTSTTSWSAVDQSGSLQKSLCPYSLVTGPVCSSRS